MKNYLKIVEEIFDEGEVKHTRTGTDIISIAGAMFKHDMKDGFPLLTTKKMPIKMIASELEFFIKGITDKEWLKERRNTIWNEWCNRDIVPYSNDKETLARMAAERDLGPIYGYQWRHFGAKYIDYKTPPEGGVDQLKNMVHMLKTNPDKKRNLVSAWNPVDQPKMALPPCHFAYQATVINGRVNLLWSQRSVDTALGLPFNIASYAIFLLLLAKETGYEPGKLVGFLGDTHIYVNHEEGLKEQLSREPLPLPHLKINNFTSIFDWKYTDIELVNYKSHPAIKFDIAV